MAATPEAKVKKVVTQQLKAMGAYYFYPVTGGYGASGVPDIIGCFDGLFFGIECKAGRNKPTDLQRKNLQEITAAGGLALIVNEGNMHTVADHIRMWRDFGPNINQVAGDTDGNGCTGV
jgi:hypothetical protein